MVAEHEQTASNRPNDFHCLINWIGSFQGFLWMSSSVLGCELEISSPGVTFTLLQVVDYYSQELAEIEWNPCNPQLSKDSHYKHWPHSKNRGNLLSITHSYSFPTWQVHFIVDWSSVTLSVARWSEDLWRWSVCWFWPPSPSFVLQTLGYLIGLPRLASRPFLCPSIFTEGKLMDGLWDNFLYPFMTWNTWTILSEFAAKKTWLIVI